MTNLLPKFTQFFAVIVTIIATTVTSFIHQPHTAPLSHVSKIKKQGISIATHETPTPEEKIIANAVTNKKNSQHLAQQTSNPIPTVLPTNALAQTPSITTNQQQTTPRAQTSIPSPLVTKTITAKSTITISGKTIYITLTYPNTGGNITGSLSGDCSGSVSGTYAGPQSGTITGSADANCSEGFLSIPVHITYTGTLASGATQATIFYTTQALGKTQSGTTLLSLVQ